MRTYATFNDGPIYIDLNIGESAVIPTARRNSIQLELLGIGYHGPIGKPGRSEMGWVRVAVGEESIDIPLGWWRTVGGLLIAAELNSVYNTEPERKRWEHDYWRLGCDARLMIIDATTPLTFSGRYVFPMVSDAWSWGYTHNWLSKYSGSSGLNPTHYGVDIDCPVGVGSVRAAMGGQIVYVGGYKEPDELGGPGTVVSIIGEDGLGYLYAHMSTLDSAIKEGASIPTRHPIGSSGMSGAENVNCTPHLHFEMLWGESPEALLHTLQPPWFDESQATLAFPINPLPYLFSWFEDYLTIEGRSI